MRKRVLIAFVLLCASRAHAHKPSDSYVTLKPTAAGLEVQWDIALRDLDYAVGLDDNGDGAITWGEVRAHREAIAAYALSRLHIEADGATCPNGPAAQLIDRHTDGAYAVLRFSAGCAGASGAFDVRYDLFFEFDPQHRGLVRVDGGSAPMSVFTVDQRRQRVGAPAAWQSVREFWRNGVWQIWGGFEHVLFLLALLMSAALRRDARGHWRPAGWRDAVSATVKVVIAFTLAHSLTLSLAALGVVHLPAHIIEAGIAASIVVAALNNAYPIFSDRRWLIGFFFGLLHGFGLARPLTEAALPVRSLMVSLLGFNLGVESGQLMIVAAFLPIAFLLRRPWAYQRLTVVAGSSAIALAATLSFLERILHS